MLAPPHPPTSLLPPPPLPCRKTLNMQLPNQWLWDIVDEFVYQYQSYCQNR